MCLYFTMFYAHICLQIATDTQLADRARLEQRIEDLEASLHGVSVKYLY